MVQLKKKKKNEQNSSQIEEFEASDDASLYHAILGRLSLNWDRREPRFLRAACRTARSTTSNLLQDTSITVIFAVVVVADEFQKS
mmetsp:Transcript_19859/g.30246  ORF Transcript_19859/g.30246 Transcript_19859/m.30246 type:complete len:85 (-) Transcript_19859:178-432(-)